MAESQIKNRVLDALEKVKLENTGLNIFACKIVLDVKADNNGCSLILENKDLDTNDGKKLREDITTALKDFYNADQIKFQFGSGPKVETVAPQSNAQLKVGHEKKTGKKTLENVKNILAVASGKGGVGKSSFTANLAISLAMQGAKVGVVDADIYGPSLPMIFGKRQEKPKATENKKMIPIEAHGIKFMSFGVFIEEKDPVIWRGPMLGGVLNQFMFDVDWGELDFLLVDMPPGTGDIQLSLSQMIELTGAIIISTPQDIAMLDARKGLAMFQKVNIPIVGMVENMSYFVCDAGKKYHIFGEGGVEKCAKELEVPFLGRVPIEITLREGSDKGQPYMSNKQFEGKPAWLEISNIAKTLNETLSIEKKKSGFFSKLLNK